MRQIRNLERFPIQLDRKPLSSERERNIARGDHEPEASGLACLAGIVSRLGDACNGQYAGRRIHPGFFRHVGPSLFPRHRAAAIGTGARLQQVAPRQRGGKQRPICRRLHQSDPEARRGHDGEKTRGHRVVRRDVSDAEQPVLALRRTLHLFPARHGDAAKAERDRLHLFAQS